MRALPLLEPRRAELETCVFCPKLCRSACPVSNAEPRETITPWGKMSLAWMAAHGDVPSDVSHAAPAWACSGCLACRESCDHRNPVADVLLDARDALRQRGAAPEASDRALGGFARHDARTRAAVRSLGRSPGVDPGAPTALLVGCGYARAARREAADAIETASALSVGPVALVEGCCGLPLRLAGGRTAFARHAHLMARSLGKYRRVLVADAGCAATLVRAYGPVGASLSVPVETLVALAARSLALLSPVAVGGGAVRWHDPCQLGRGLGLYDAPRAVLARVLGRPPDEFEERREQSACAGSGGLLPATMPDVARAIAEDRLGAHALAGGGRVVTACASSLLALRRRARRSGFAVDDLVTWIARGTRRNLG
jgi:Fe-S oxidoreductase